MFPEGEACSTKVSVVMPLSTQIEKKCGFRPLVRRQHRGPAMRAPTVDQSRLSYRRVAAWRVLSRCLQSHRQGDGRNATFRRMHGSWLSGRATNHRPPHSRWHGSDRVLRSVDGPRISCGSGTARVFVTMEMRMFVVDRRTSHAQRGCRVWLVSGNDLRSSLVYRGVGSSGRCLETGTRAKSMTGRSGFSRSRYRNVSTQTIANPVSGGSRCHDQDRHCDVLPSIWVAG